MNTIATVFCVVSIVEASFIGFLLHMLNRLLEGREYTEKEDFFDD